MNPNIITSTARSLRPGMNTLPADTERHTVRAGGITALELHPGDEIQLVNPEGMQLGEITAFNQQGKSDMQYLG
ncbi:MAG: aminomethyltransferase, partial [Rubritalea sp.]